MKNHKSKQNALALYRRRMGFSQKKVSDLLGFRDTSMLSHYERGRMFPSLKAALGLEIILRTPVAFLFPNLYRDLKETIREMEERRLAGQE